MTQSASHNDIEKRKQRKHFIRNVKAHWDLYLLLIPSLTLLIIYRYVPIYGVTIAFKDYNLLDGIMGSPWVGLKYFRQIFSSQYFFTVLRNTILINVYRLIWQFPVPIIIALMINEVQNVRFKRLTQTISYLPHFLSWVVIAAIFYDVLSPSTGVIGKLLKSITGQHVMLMANPKWFRSILVFSVGWKDSGYSAIVYLAAMMAIDPQLYEAADIDGAGKFRKIWHITIPGIIPTIFFIIMLRLGAMLGDDTQQVLMFYNPSVYSVGDVLGTYVYRVGLGQMKYSYATALGLFTSLVGFMLLTSTNYVIDRLGYRALF